MPATHGKQSVPNLMQMSSKVRYFQCLYRLVLTNSPPSPSRTHTFMDGFRRVVLKIHLNAQKVWKSDNQITKTFKCTMFQQSISLNLKVKCIMPIIGLEDGRVNIHASCASIPLNKVFKHLLTQGWNHKHHAPVD